MTFLKDKTFLSFVIKFLSIFLICYYGTLAVVGITVPGGYYSPFVDHYLNYISWVRSSLLHGSLAALKLFGINTYQASEYILRMVNGKGISLVYGCLGFGVMSFWLAFVIASSGSFKKKLIWIIAGLIFIWILNITRLSLVLVAINKNWPMPLGWDHHTWFNIFSYLFIFIFIFLFNRQHNKSEMVKEKNNHVN